MTGSGLDLVLRRDDDDSCCVVICTNKLMRLRNVLARCECLDQERSVGSLDLQTLLNDALMDWETSDSSHTQPTPPTSHTEPPPGTSQSGERDVTWS